MLSSTATAVRRILLVEDDLAHAELLKRSLDKYCDPCLLHHVADGEEALDYLLGQGGAAAGIQHRGHPHLILLDLRLPKVDGLEVLKTIKESVDLRKIPVVLLTTSRADRDVARAYECHANSYLVKPMDFAEFDRLAQILSQYWMLWNQYSEVGT